MHLLPHGLGFGGPDKGTLPQQSGGGGGGGVFEAVRRWPCQVELAESAGRHASEHGGAAEVNGVIGVQRFDSGLGMQGTGEPHHVAVQRVVTGSWGRRR